MGNKVGVKHTTAIGDLCVYLFHTLCPALGIHTYAERRHGMMKRSDGPEKYYNFSPPKYASAVYTEVFVQSITLYHTIYLISLNLYSNLLKKKKGVRNLAELKGAVLQLDPNGISVFSWDTNYYNVNNLIFLL
jgi:hypothetical protein